MANTIPQTGFLRESDLLGRRAISPEEAAANRAAGKRGRRPREAKPGILPVCSATLWRWVNAGTFPAPVRIPGSRIAVWKCESVRAFIESQVPKR